jgi:chemotaxis protein histidine kinase CheA
VPSETENQFLDEVLGLFALEAQEWVSQVNSALAELESSCSPERGTKLYETIVRGVSNLGGSAATVELGRIEKLAFGLLPVLQAMQAVGGTPSPESLHAVRQALDRIVATVQGLSETKSDAMPDLEELLSQLAGTTTEGVTAASPHTEATSRSPDPEPLPVSPSASRTELIRSALLGYQEAQARTPDQSRNLAEVVLRKAQADADDALDESAIGRALRELEMLDEQFLEEVRRRAPAINKGFVHFKGDQAGSSPPGAHGRERIFQDIEHLYEISRLVNSTPIMFYLRGLRHFLQLATDRPTLIPSQRYDAVGSRLALLQALAERWVEIGRSERATIEKILHP